jgi:tRNA(fMet)-specific endonuclease VapC
MEVALDSNILWDILAGDDVLNQRIKSVDSALPLPVYAEARCTVLNSGRRAENHARLERFLLTCKVLPMTPYTADLYAEIRLPLKRKGRPIPNHDIWIAAVCLEPDLPLATWDSDFQHVDGRVVLNR